MSSKIQKYKPLSVDEVLPFLACPQCHMLYGLVKGAASSAPTIICPSCGKTFPLTNGVPDFRPPEITALSPTDLHSSLKARLQKCPGLFRTIQIINRILFPVVNLASNKNLRELGSTCQKDFPHLPIINLGSGAGSGRGVAYLPRRIDLDAVPMPGVTVLADARSLPFADGTVAAVVTQGVLEHLPDPWTVAREAMRVLAPGGHLYVEVPLMEGYHADPDDYWRFTRSGLRVIFARLAPYREGATSGPASAAGLFLREFIGSFSSNRWIHAFLKYIVGSILAIPLRPFDYWLGRKKNAHMLAASLHFWGIKPPSD